MSTILDYTFCLYCKGPNDMVHFNNNCCNKCFNKATKKTKEISDIRYKYKIGQFGLVKESEWYRMMYQQYLEN